MELLDGETVFDRLARDGTMPVGEVLWVALNVLDVLIVAHAYGVIHRDLKPENLLLGSDGRLKVLDFGSPASSTSSPTSPAILPEQTLTRTGTAIGSCEYMAPEQASGRVSDTDGRTDLFGLGATMYPPAVRALHPRRPRGRAPPHRRRDAAGGGARERGAPSLPAVCAVVDRALAFDKGQRYPDARAMRADVAAVRTGREPPYVRAIADGQIRPGESLFAR